MGGARDPREAVIDRLLADPNVTADRKAALQAKKASFAQNPQQGAPAPPSRPSEVMGAFVPVPDYTMARENAVIQAANQELAPEKALPTAYRPPVEESRGRTPFEDVPILFREGLSKDDEGWKSAMDRAAQRGVSAYRVNDEFPMSFDSAEGIGNIGFRGVTGVLAPFVLGMDRSLTGGLATKGSTLLAEKAGILPGGTANELSETVSNNPVEGAAGAIAGALHPGGLAGRIGGGASRLFGVGKGGIPRQVASLAGAGAAGGATQTTAEGLVDKLAGGTRDVADDALRSAVFGGVLGPVFGMLGKLGRHQQASLRDPTKDTGRDLLLAEAGGAKTRFPFGIKPGPLTVELAEEGKKLGGVAPEGLAAERVVEPLGKALQQLRGTPQAGASVDDVALPAAKKLGEVLGGYRESTLGSIAQENQALYADAPEVSMEPLMRESLKLIRKATHADGTAMPGQTTRAAVQGLKSSAKVQIVDAGSDAAQTADPETMIPLGFARRLGLVADGADNQAGDAAKKVVILKPRTTPVDKLEDARRLMDQASGDIGANAPQKNVSKGLASAAREARDAVPGMASAKAAQAERLNAMKNMMEAAGLPREGSVDVGDFGTVKALYNSMLRYGTPGNAAADAEINKLVAMSPELKAFAQRVIGSRAGVSVPQDVKNAMEMSGLPADSPVNLDDSATREALQNRALRYKTHPTTVVGDRVLDELAGSRPELRKALTDAASVGATQRLRGKTDVRLAVTPNGAVKPYGAGTSIRLGLDPIMGVLGSMGAKAPGIVPGTASELARAYRNRRPQ